MSPETHVPLYDRLSPLERLSILREGLLNSIVEIYQSPASVDMSDPVRRYGNYLIGHIMWQEQIENVFGENNQREAIRKEMELELSNTPIPLTAQELMVMRINNPIFRSYVYQLKHIPNGSPEVKHDVNGMKGVTFDEIALFEEALSYLSTHPVNVYS